MRNARGLQHADPMRSAELGAKMLTNTDPSKRGCVWSNGAGPFLRAARAASWSGYGRRDAASGIDRAGRFVHGAASRPRHWGSPAGVLVP